MSCSPESSIGLLGEDREQKIRAQRKETELMQTNTYEHVFPLSKTCGISPLEHQASGILENYSLHEYSLPPEISLSPSGSDKFLCDLSK